MEYIYIFFSLKIIINFRKASQVSEAVKSAIMNFTSFEVEEETLMNLTNIFSEFIHLIERSVRLTSVKSSVIVCDSRETEGKINVSYLNLLICKLFLKCSVEI